MQTEPELQMSMPDRKDALPAKHSQLTGTMQAAIAHATAHGGLVRQPGGSWVAPKDEQDWGWGRVRFGTSTVAGLVNRGALVYVEHKDGRNGRFPIRAAITNATQGEV